uniref:BRCT domain-containing protein n=1 Tax=Taenia asiatica TaxID=60517 RepID=A0A0R3VTW2_TAEAS
LKSPLDLLIRTSTPSPSFELCCERLFQLNCRRDGVGGEVNGHESEHHEALTALNEIANSPPAHCIFTPMRLPLSEEGMIPRLWRVHQHMLTLQRTALAVTMSWTRDLLHLLLPHGLALRADNLLLGGASKCSVTFAEVSLESTGGMEASSSSMLGKRSKYGGRKRPNRWFQSRRSWLSGQNVLKMDISQALRLVNHPNSPQASTVCDGSPSNERNLDLLYLSGGVPIVRIETWLANHNGALAFEKSSFTNPSSSNFGTGGGGDEKTAMCRDLAVVTCVYGSHLTVGLTASCQMDGTPGVDLILNTMLRQLNHLYRLLDSRFPAKPVIYAPRRRFHLAVGPGPSATRTRTIQSGVRTHNRPQTASNSISSQFSPATLYESPSSDAIGGELIEEKGNQFLKYNFPPLSSSLRRSPLRRSQKRHGNEASIVGEAGDEAGGTSKLVPVPKSPPMTKKTEAKSPRKRKRVDESFKSGTTKKKLESTRHLKNYHRFGLARKVAKKRPVKPPPPNPRKSQVRFVTEED